MIATIIPIGLLIVAVDTRSAIRFFVAGAPTGVRYVMAGVMGAIAGLAVFAEIVCVNAVASGEILTSVPATLVTVAAYALLVPVCLGILAALGGLFSGNE